MQGNYAFIDGQNLYLSTTKCEGVPWEADLTKLRIYLRDKYNVSKAFYYLGYLVEDKNYLYEEIQSAGYVLIFREHNSAMIGKKKGNVDSDIILDIMKRIYKNEPFKKIILVSGDGDYKKLIDFLIEEDRFEKILFPNNTNKSSLYDKLGSEYFDSLSSLDIKKKIQKKKGAP